MSHIYHKTDDPVLRYALREIESSYGDEVQPKHKSLNKFGESLLIGTAEATVMTLPAGVLNETYSTTNNIDSISSSNDSDTNTMVIEGHTVDGSGNFTFSIQTVTLSGRTKVTLATPVARVSRVYNNDSTEFLGSVYVYETGAISNGVPDTDEAVHLICTPEEQQSLKAATTFSNDDYCIITEVYGAVNKKTAASAVLRLKVREKGGVFRTRLKLAATTDGAHVRLPRTPYIIVPPNADVILTAEASGAGTPVAAGFDSYLAIKSSAV